MDKIKKILAVLVVLMFISPSVFATAADPTFEGPIDGGISALIAAGVAYGAKKYRDYKKGKTDK
ncbi:MAG: hypothetical protein MJ211_07925 [Bacteroidales bacterium]|nr:hypothetical protein [Bacteroidales bacterium]